MSALDTLLRLPRPLLTDGALATNLFAQGLQPGIAPELWNVDEPARVVSVHRAFVEAGADIILTNSFGANRGRLAGATADRVCALNRRAASHARRATADAGRPVLVAGAVGPTGSPVDACSETVAADIFREQMAALAEGGVDVIWIETLSDPAAMRAAAAAAASVGLPFALTASPHPGSRLDAPALAALARSHEPAPFAVGFNCGIGPADMLAQMPDLSEDAGLTWIAKPNAGLPRPDGSYPATAQDFARFAAAAVALGVRIVGGCCGSTPAHLRAMHRAMHRNQG